ncbi:MAG: hypothetical protein Q3988_06890 [Gemella sp.]|nr:hypothetical protein [Gemella sp.]
MLKNLKKSNNNIILENNGEYNFIMRPQAGGVLVWTGYIFVYPTTDKNVTEFKEKLDNFKLIKTVREQTC